MPAVAIAVPALCLLRRPCWHRPGSHQGYDSRNGMIPHLDDHAGGHLRHGGRRLRLADRAVHDLWRHPAGSAARESSLSTSPSACNGRQAVLRGAHGRALLLPARRAIRAPACRDDRHAGDRRLADDEARSDTAADDAGGLLAAGGLGAIISPPVMGAAAFLIAEYLKIGYLDVIKSWPIVPTLPLLRLAAVHGGDSTSGGSRRSARRTSNAPPPRTA